MVTVTGWGVDLRLFRVPGRVENHQRSPSSTLRAWRVVSPTKPQVWQYRGFGTVASVDGVDRVSVSGFGSVRDIPMFFLVALKKNMSVFEKDVEVFLKSIPKRTIGFVFFGFVGRIYIQV